MIVTRNCRRESFQPYRKLFQMRIQDLANLRRYSQLEKLKEEREGINGKTLASSACALVKVTDVYGFNLSSRAIRLESRVGGGVLFAAIKTEEKEHIPLTRHEQAEFLRVSPKICNAPQSCKGTRILFILTLLPFLWFPVSAVKALLLLLLLLLRLSM